MPFALIIIGVLIVLTAINNTAPAFGSQVYKDLFSEDGGFVYWVAGIVIVGLFGYVPSLKKPSDLFMILIIVAMLMKNGGFFTTLQQGLANASGSGTSATTTTGALGTISGIPGVSSLIGTAEQNVVFSNPVTGTLAMQQMASAGLGSDTPTITNETFNGLTDEQVLNA